MRRPRPRTTSTRAIRCRSRRSLGRAAFEEGDPDIGENEIRNGISRAWLTSLSWRYLPSPRFAVTQRLYSTGLRFDNDNRAGATLDAARFTELGWRADASFSPAPRAGRRVRRRRPAARGQERDPAAVVATSGQVTLNDYDERAAAGSAYGQVRIGLARD